MSPKLSDVAARLGDTELHNLVVAALAAADGLIADARGIPTDLVADLEWVLRSGRLVDGAARSVRVAIKACKRATGD